MGFFLSLEIEFSLQGHLRMMAALPAFVLLPLIAVRLSDEFTLKVLRLFTVIEIPYLI